MLVPVNCLGIYHTFSCKSKVVCNSCDGIPILLIQMIRRSFKSVLTILANLVKFVIVTEENSRENMKDSANFFSFEINPEMTTVLKSIAGVESSILMLAA